MRLKRVVILSILALSGLGFGWSSQALANEVQCRKVLQSFYQSLPAPQQVELPADVQKVIAQSVFNNWGQGQQLGKDLLISLDPLSRTESLSEIVIGEEIQAQFIARILRQALPLAEITGLRPKDLTPMQTLGKKVIELRLVDSQERKAFASQMKSDPTLLDMPLVKPANGAIRSLQEQIWQLKAKVKNKSKTATIYFPAFYFDSEVASSKNPDLGGLALHLQQNMGVKTLILSPNPRALVMGVEVLEQMLRSHYPEVMQTFKKIIPLSEVRNWQEIYQSEYNLILNDTKGRMPFVYGLSDLVVVQGPINPIESVMVQTPTFAFVNEAVVGTYGLERYSQMISAAQKSGKFLAVDSLEQIQPQALHELERAMFIAPDLNRSTGLSPLEALLEVLQQKISAQIQ